MNVDVDVGVGVGIFIHRYICQLKFEPSKPLLVEISYSINIYLSVYIYNIYTYSLWI